MATLAAIEKQIATLKAKADALRKTEVAAAAKTVRKLIHRFGLTAADVGLDGKVVKSGKARKTVNTGTRTVSAGVAKYRDPATGKTWTGRGKPPAWISVAADRTSFLIAEAQSPVSSTGSSAGKGKRAARAAAAEAPDKPVSAVPKKKASRKKVVANKPVARKTGDTKRAVTRSASEPPSSKKAASSKRLAVKAASAAATSKAAKAKTSPAPIEPSVSEALPAAA